VNVSAVVKESFKAMASKTFHSDVQQLDFTNANASSDAINKWVEANTNNMIKNMTKPEDICKGNLLVLINAIHFKAFWTSPFTENRTGTFRTPTKDYQTTFMTKTTYRKYFKSENLDAQFVELSYKDALDTSMILVIPNEVDGLQQIERKFNSLNIILNFNSLALTSVILEIPKFNVEFDAKLIDILRKVRRSFQNMFVQSFIE